MKKVIRTIAAAALFFATTTAMAKEPTLETDGLSKSLVFEWNELVSGASLKIYDTNGRVIYTDYMNELDTYNKKFDLSLLPEGNYFLKIDNVTKELEYSITINKENISIVGMKENTKPVFRRKEGRVYLNFLNGSMNDVRVRVTDTHGNILFEETFKESFVVEKAFNFKAAVKDDYTIAVSIGERTYYETMNVK